MHDYEQEPEPDKSLSLTALLISGVGHCTTDALYVSQLAGQQQQLLLQLSKFS